MQRRFSQTKAGQSPVMKKLIGDQTEQSKEYICRVYWINILINVAIVVVFLIFLLRITTRTTRRLPTNPMMITRVNIIGTTMGTTLIRIRRCSSSISSISMVEFSLDSIL